MASDNMILYWSKRDAIFGFGRTWKITRRIFFFKEDIATFPGRLLDIKGRVTQDPRNVKLVAAYPIAIAWPGRSLDRATRGLCLVRTHKTTAPRLDYGSKRRSRAVQLPTYDILKLELDIALLHRG